MLPFFKSSVRLYIYLPLEYNPDPEHPERPRVEIPDALHDATITEIEQYLGERFEGLNFEFVIKKRPAHGRWQGIEDKLMVLHLDVTFSRKDFQWLKHVKDTTWKTRYQQLKMYAVYHRIFEL